MRQWRRVRSGMEGLVSWWVGKELGIGSFDLRKKMILTCVRHV
jgi:hypothetical protein